MPAQIPASHRDLLEKPVVVGLVTVMPDGQPQATPVWCLLDGEHIVVNTARGRQKDHNLQTNPQATVLAIDPQNPYRYLEVRGTVDESTEQGALDVINQLSEHYTGEPDYYHNNPDRRNQEQRVTYKIRPTHVNARG